MKPTSVNLLRSHLAIQFFTHAFSDHASLITNVKSYWNLVVGSLESGGMKQQADIWITVKQNIVRHHACEKCKLYPPTPSPQFWNGIVLIILHTCSGVVPSSAKSRGSAPFSNKYCNRNIVSRLKITSKLYSYRSNFTDVFTLTISGFSKLNST